MKKLATLFSAFLLIAGLASAQTADSTAQKHFGGRKMAAHHRFGRHGFGEKLNLTDAQKAQMKTANENYHKQLKDLQSNNSISLGEYKAKLAELQKNHRSQVQGILTDEQKKTLADGRKNVQKRMRARGAANLEKMKTQLGLTDDQAAKIKSQREATRTQLQSLRSDSTLLPEQKREKMKEIFVHQRDEMKSILTPEQLTKLQSMRKEHSRGRRMGDNQSK